MGSTHFVLIRMIRALRSARLPHLSAPPRTRRTGASAKKKYESCPPTFRQPITAPIAHSDVPAMMRSHDLFFLPTRGENFGHVIVEAMREGCPALITNTTAFRNLEQRSAGWDLPLDDLAGFRRALQKCAAMSPEKWLRWSDGARPAGGRHHRRRKDHGHVSGRISPRRCPRQCGSGRVKEPAQ